MVRISDLFQYKLGRPVQYYPALARLLASKDAAIFIGQLVYWTGKEASQDGWIYKTREDLELETGLTRWEQEQARKALRTVGVLSEKRRGIPCRLFYRVDLDRLNEIVDFFLDNLSNDYPRLPVSSKLDCEKPAPKNAGKQQTSLRETCKPAGEKPADSLSKHRLRRDYQETTSSSKTDDAANPDRAQTKNGDQYLLTHDDSPLFVALPLDDGSHFNVTENMAAEWQELFPVVDVRAALKHMKAWLTVNPPKGMDQILRFIVNWLGTERDKVRAAHPSSPPPQKSASPGKSAPRKAPSLPPPEPEEFTEEQRAESLRIAAFFDSRYGTNLSGKLGSVSNKEPGRE